SESVTHAAVYIWDSPSARWGLRPQAPIWVLAKFGDKRSSILAATFGLARNELGRKVCT
ncbi:hypothetical protein J6590_107510, partial [Homalodisca vitripennis]